MRSELTAFRKMIGLTISEMAKMVGLSTSNWCNIEKGRANGNADMWINLGVKFGLSLEELKNLMEVK